MLQSAVYTEVMEQLHLIFSYFDKNQNGCIGFTEFVDMEIVRSRARDDQRQLYQDLCTEYAIDPDKGFTLTQLQKVYASMPGSLARECAAVLSPTKRPWQVQKELP